VFIEMGASTGIAPRIFKKIVVHAIDLSRLHMGLCSCSGSRVPPWQRTMGHSGPQRVSSFNISIRRNRSTRNLLALRRIWS